MDYRIEAATTGFKDPSNMKMSVSSTTPTAGTLLAISGQPLGMAAIKNIGEDMRHRWTEEALCLFECQD